MLLAGDVGGTKTKLAIFAQGNLRTPLTEDTLASANYASLTELVRNFLAQVDFKVSRASFGIPGPVIGRRSKATNLPWVVDASQLEQELGLSSAHLLNDLEALALAVPLLEDDDLHTLSPGTPVPNGTIAVVAPGTGLGEAFLTWDGARYLPHASEGSHVEFGPTSAIQMDLLSYLLEDFEHVSYERVCSGLGLPNIFKYLKESGHAIEPAWLASQLKSADDPTPVIVNAALDNERECALCVETLDIFVSILGAEAGNLALKVMATGGVYLGGGIPPRIIPALEKAGFLEAFRAKGRMINLMETIPVYVILNSNAALIGLANYGWQQ